LRLKSFKASDFALSLAFFVILRAGETLLWVGRIKGIVCFTLTWCPQSVIFCQSGQPEVQTQ